MFHFTQILTLCISGLAILDLAADRFVKFAPIPAKAGISKYPFSICHSSEGWNLSDLSSDKIGSCEKLEPRNP
ncbi:MAG: hypothetical protein B7X86_14715 [Sphingobacteriales bacterium 17-39-43]|nr:MAG: hypothetical protein B7Y24_14600 [Sphingobacteriales bacterium 16-39-50]OZA22687.1 MAG: hypothetical protein B7X86_14715 [Sphingobacteriales bacterium 17-39-43]